MSLEEPTFVADAVDRRLPLRFFRSPRMMPLTRERCPETHDEDLSPEVGREALTTADLHNEDTAVEAPL